MDASTPLTALSAHACETTRWFSQEVQPHEPSLRAYLRGRFPQLADPDDVVQEAFFRVVKARENGSLRSARSFLFTTARNLAVDRFRENRNEIVADIENLDAHSVIDAGRPDALTRERHLEILEAAIDSLPARCRMIIRMKKIEGLSYEEIASRMGISVRTVGVQITLGMGKCRDYLLCHGVMEARKS